MSRVIAHLRAQWLGALALFLVIAGGTAYAADTIGSGDVIDNSLVSADLANNRAVKSGDVKAETLTGADIADGQVSAADLAPPEPWHEVGPAAPSEDLCEDPNNVGVFCTRIFAGVGGIQPWQNFGSGYATAAFYQDQLGLVHLKGLLDHVRVGGYSPTPIPIFRLPEGDRPTSTRTFGSSAKHTRASGDTWETAPARIEVWPDGLVKVIVDCYDSDPATTCSGVERVALDGISFRPDE